MRKLYGECGHEGCNFNDELLCMLCGEYSDNLLTKEEYERIF